MSQQAQAMVQTKQKTSEPSSAKGSILPHAAVIPAITPAHSGILQRCSGGVECEECRQKREGTLQRAAVSSTPVNENGNGVPPIVHDVLSSPGQSLDAGTRAFMEPRFGHDFSGVRVHTDRRAAESARAVNALAYTVGRDVVFGTGQYAPGTSEGRGLLAHELTHVVQQGPIVSRKSLPVGAVGDMYEREADQIANIVGEGSSSSSRSTVSSAGGLQGQSRLQRLIRTTEVHCPPAAAGVPSPNPFTADRRASALLDTAITKIDAARALHAINPADPDVVDVANALHTAFRLPNNDDTWTLGPPHVRLPVIHRRLEFAKDYIDSVVFTIHCLATGGGPDGMPCGTRPALREAYTCAGDATDLALCPVFWASNLNQRGRILAHEVFHINFGFIEDWGSPDVHNAHCYAQFVALLNGFNSPAGFRCH